MQEQNNIYELIADIRHHIASLKDFIEELKGNNECSPVIKWSILASLSLFFIGVIYPLGFLPLPQNVKMQLDIRNVPNYVFSAKGAFLFVFASIFTGINLYFLNINAKMAYGNTDIEKLKAFTDFGDYHVYFKDMEENQKAKDEFFKKAEEAKQKAIGNVK